MTSATAYMISQGLLIAAPLVLIGWDLFVYLWFGREATESHAMYEWSLKFKGFALAVMLGSSLLCWHFFV
jgi:hypothetical protein